MKKIITTVTLLIIATHFMSAQPVIKGEVYLGANIGIGGQFYLSEFGDAFPFISGSYQQCFRDNWTFNIQAGYGTAKSPTYKIVNDEYFIEYQYLLGTAQVRYHFFLSENNDWDAYGGVGLFGYYGKGELSLSESISDVNATYSDENDYGFTVLAGIRYWIGSSFALYGEFSYNTLYSSVGIIYHLK